MNGAKKYSEHDANEVHRATVELALRDEQIRSPCFRESRSNPRFHQPCNPSSSIGCMGGHRAARECCESHDRPPNRQCQSRPAKAGPTGMKLRTHSTTSDPARFKVSM